MQRLLLDRDSACLKSKGRTVCALAAKDAIPVFVTRARPKVARTELRSMCWDGAVLVDLVPEPFF